MFDGQTPGVSSIKIEALIEWANGTANRNPVLPPLSLPPIQRSALWRPAQILGLWDSLLLGMPIGMLYLIPARNTSRPLEDGRRDAHGAPEAGLDLFDGQQRLRALLLATSPPDVAGKCIWVDFGAEIDPNGLYVPLRLTTRSQPFGYAENGTKLSIDQRRRAREIFDATMEGKAGYDKQLPDHKLFEEAPDGPPSPACSIEGTRRPSAIQLRRLLSMWKSDGASFATTLQDCLKEAALGFSYEKIVARLEAGFERLTTADVPLLLLKPASVAQGIVDEPEWLLRWFERIGAGGTPLTSAERCFSIYKHYQPEVYDVVTAIECTVGHVMSPVDIVGTALRIANAQTGNYWPPDHTIFGKAIRDEASKLKQQLDLLIPPNRPNGGGPLGVAFERAMTALRYVEPANPNGFPPVALAELPTALLRVVVYWAYLHPESSPADLDPDEMIRFALFWHLCAENHEKGERRAFRCLNDLKASGAAFPGRELYEFLTGDDATALQLVRPEHIKDYLPKVPNDQWLGEKQLFDRPEATVAGTKALFRAWWYSRGKMLLWLQRQYLARAFPHYDPSSNRDEEKPYDLDHIQPQAIWGEHWASQQSLIDKADRTHFNNGRGHLGNAIGNFRWIGSSQNRSDGAISVRQKLQLGSRDDMPTNVPDWAVGILRADTLQDW